MEARPRLPRQAWNAVLRLPHDTWPSRVLAPLAESSVDYPVATDTRHWLACVYESGRQQKRDFSESWHGDSISLVLVVCTDLAMPGHETQRRTWTDCLTTKPIRLGKQGSAARVKLNSNRPAGKSAVFTALSFSVTDKSAQSSWWRSWVRTKLALCFSHQPSKRPVPGSRLRTPTVINNRMALWFVAFVQTPSASI